MLSAKTAKDVLEKADVLFSATDVNRALDRMAKEITAGLGDQHPLILSVMGGAVVFTGQILPKLVFPLDFDYIHASRYADATTGGVLHWKVLPKENVAGRVVLVLDDILDQGHTLAAIRDKILAMGADKFYSAVFAFKETGKPKPIQADYVGLKVPDRFVFGFGMDVSGAWRNLPGIYAMPEDKQVGKR